MSRSAGLLRARAGVSSGVRDEAGTAIVEFALILPVIGFGRA